jgi:hypothetical protein
MAPLQINDATLYLGDCRDVLPTLGAVSHVLCDPPYEAEPPHFRGGRIPPAEPASTARKTHAYFVNYIADRRPDGFRAVA